MLGFKQIELTDKGILNNFFSHTQNQNSECTFTNLYMWRRCYAVRWVVVDGHLIIQPNAFESSWILPPYGISDNDDDFKNALEKLAESYLEIGKPFVIRGVTETEMKRIEKVWPKAFRFLEEPEIWDYIYNAEDLRSLKGRKYSKKRNHLNGFIRDYPEYTFEEVNMEKVPEVLDFLEYWYGKQNRLDEINDSLLCEREAIYDALIRLNELDFKGGLIRVNGKIIALTLGEQVNDDTVVIHVEKAFSDYRGAYTAINHLYLNHFWKDIKYVNREEDMGLPGLKKAKQSYYPQYLLKKFKGVMVCGKKN